MSKSGKSPGKTAKSPGKSKKSKGKANRPLRQIVQLMKIRDDAEGGDGPGPRGPRPTGGTNAVRTLGIACSMTLRDHESIGSDEFASLSFPETQEAVYTGHRLVKHLEGRCGGEIRLELDVFASVGAADSITVNVDARLYEGSSDGTGDLDGRGNFTIVVPAAPDNYRSIQATIWNTDEDEPDDNGFFLLFLRNNG